MTGATLSRYRIGGELGRGGMGIVYSAYDTRLKRTVAIKVLSSAAVASDTDRVRFHGEARAAARLSHPNVATVYEIDEAVPSDAPYGTGASPFIAMEYIEGETLAALIAKGPLGLDDVVRIGAQIAAGLEAAHKAGIVHRDIKPSNVMLTAEGDAKVLDFGLALTELTTKITRTDSTVGTVAYMSPEQARGDEVDFRTDVWAVGAVLYEMLAGRRPFRGEYEQAIVYSILNVAPEALSSHRNEVPQQLERLIHRCLSKSADDRFSSMGELREELTQLAAPSRSTLDRAGAIYSSKSRVTMWAAGLVFVVAAVATLSWRMMANEVPALPDDLFGVAIAPFWGPTERALGEGRTLQLLVERSLRESLSASHEARVSARELTRPPQTEEEARTLGATHGASVILWGEVLTAGDEVLYQPTLTFVGGRHAEARLRAFSVATESTEGQFAPRIATAEQLVQVLLTAYRNHSRWGSLDAQLRFAAAAGNQSNLERLVRANRLAIKPVVYGLVTDAITKEADGLVLEASESAEAATEIAASYQRVFGELSLVTATAPLATWSFEEKGKKLIADSLYTLATRIRRDRLDDARIAYEEAIDVYTDIGDDVGLAAALGGKAFVAFFQNRSAFIPLLKVALQQRRLVDDRQLIGNSLFDLGLGYRTFMQEPEVAMRYFEEAWGIRVAIGDTPGLLRLLPHLTGIEIERGSMAAARQREEEAASLFLALGDTSSGLRLLGDVMHQSMASLGDSRGDTILQGSLQAQVSRLSQLLTAWSYSDSSDLAFAHWQLGRAAAFLADTSGVARHFQTALSLYGGTADSLLLARTWDDFGRSQLRLEMQREAESAFREAEALFLALGDSARLRVVRENIRVASAARD